MRQGKVVAPEWSELESRLLCSTGASLSVHAAPAPAAAASGSVSVKAPAKCLPGPQVCWRVANLADGARLTVLGTNGPDAITVSKAGGNTVIYVSGVRVWTSGQVFSSVVVYGFGGEDQLVTVSGAAETVYGGTGRDSFWVDSGDVISDVIAAERSAGSVHVVDEFYAPTPAGPVPLELGGQPLPDPAADYPYRNFSGGKVFSDGPQYDDVLQGVGGDCYFLAVLSSLAMAKPGIIREMIAPLGDGTYGVRFFADGRPVYVRVDADLPVHAGSTVLAYASPTRDGELWVPLVEKAYAEFRTRTNSYDSIATGYAAPAYADVTGVLAGDTYTPRSSEADLVGRIRRAMQAGRAATVVSNYAGSTAIVGEHAYAIRSIQTFKGKTTVTVYNPWGVDGKPDDDDTADGLVTLTMSQFRQVFVTLSISGA